MTDDPVRYGPNSPFDAEERSIIEAIYERLARAGDPGAAQLGDTIKRQMVCLEWLGEVLANYPSPLSEQQLGTRQRGLQTLVDSLCNTNPATFEFHLPTRALLGRSLVMAESNFYRLLGHVCREAFDGQEASNLHAQTVRRLRVCLYTRLVEEVLTAIASDIGVDREVRAKAVVALAQIWERRLTYRVSDFFPILEATWEARQKFTAVGGTLSGTQEMFELFKAGADPRFVDFFARPNPSEDEIEAFREFLFGALTEELDRLTREMRGRGDTSTVVRDRTEIGDQDPATVFYGFFRFRQLQATARRLAGVPGPKRTAEVYVMISYLEQLM